MSLVPVTLASRDYDFVAPLALGDVPTEGIALRLLRSFDALERLLADAAIDGGEASFSRYVQRFAVGDRSLVGLPVFLMREFRHRCFFVRRDSGLTDLTHLAGKRVGVDAWPASGNTWSRALLRERGVALDAVRWLVGPVNPGDPPPTATLPPGAEPAPAGRSLAELLLAGQLDAMMCPWPPRAFHEPASPIVRLYTDYRAAERDYYRRTQLYPAHHLLVLRRALVEAHPWIVAVLYQAFVQAREQSERNHRVLHESSPWVLADLEEQDRLMGAEFRPYGYRENRAMVAAFCAEQLAQRLIPHAVEPDALFADFEKLVAAGGPPLTP